MGLLEAQVRRVSGSLVLRELLEARVSQVPLVSGPQVRRGLLDLLGLQMAVPVPQARPVLGSKAPLAAPVQQVKKVIRDAPDLQALLPDPRGLKVRQGPLQVKPGRRDPGDLLMDSLALRVLQALLASDLQGLPARKLLDQRGP
jgi:hypothetical protein